tara:strand:- start:2195 stop:2722 length:528 start_codon:yes stop_codon:yes gene_type:complete
MPYKSGKLKGELTSPELRRMIKLHNKMVGIEVPTGSKRPDLIRIIESNGFKIDHKEQKLIPETKLMIRKKNVPLPPAVKRKPRVVKPKIEPDAKAKRRADLVKGTNTKLVNYRVPRVKVTTADIASVNKLGKTLPKDKSGFLKVKKVTATRKGGFHRMPDGTIMKDSDMKKKKSY